MGDRSNIVVKQPDGTSVWLYGHWMGEDSINIVHDVLARKQRWTDHSYLTRMLFEKMIAGNLDGETGFGISTTMQDNEYPIIILDPSSQTVWLEEYKWDGSKSFEVITPAVTFEEFINASSVSDDFVNLAVNMGSKLTPA